MMPTTILLTKVKTLLSIPMMAMGMSSPYWESAPYLASMILQTREMITMVIWVTNEEAPSFRAAENTRKWGIKFCADSRNVLVRKK